MEQDDKIFVVFSLFSFKSANKARTLHVVWNFQYIVFNINNSVRKIGREEKLYTFEMQTALKLFQEKFSIARIAKIINRSRNVISKFVKNPNIYDTKNSNSALTRWVPY